MGYKVLLLPLALVLLSTATKAFFCDGIPPGLKIRHPIAAICNEYFACHHSQEHPWFCPRGQFFSQRTQTCVATCDTSESLNPCIGMPNGQLVRPPLLQPNNCRQHYECISGMMVPRECEIGTFFSQLNQGCGSVREPLCIPG
ncbi:conserved hypothetical protein [Culex quinquefasciatus]|uniref:Chitin-binding type-2 domain-containing protein n=1 Tax=Culex quinquefasciatus TaxID=7176 RepID=B0XHM6_CULQU|nr:conserved hypothetical protein [Culex quinquefasciatus]|eukprot:XP_001869148.1 conserved hypothetical protein [Culex quinquefasciatus]